MKVTGNRTRGFAGAATIALCLSLSSGSFSMAQEGGLNPRGTLSAGAPPGAGHPAPPVPETSAEPSPGSGIASLGATGEMPGGASPTRSPAIPDAQGGGDMLRTLTGGDPSRLSVPLRILALLTVLTLVPSIVLLTTCFPRIVIVLSFVRRAIGTQELPPNQVIIGLSLFLTAMIMGPVWKEIHSTAIVPYQANEIGEEEAARRALLPLKKFMIDHTLRSDLRLFVELSKYEEDAARRGVSPESEPLTELPITVVVPAFVLSEMKTAFQMGFLLYLPFVIIDLIISTALISMGMLVLPPILISFPLKVLVFVLVDGWRLIVEELVKSFI